MNSGAERSLASLIGAILPGEARAGAVSIEEARLTFNPEAHPKKPADYVLVWMQKAQRSRENPALDLGFHLANTLGLPLLVLFILDDYPGATSIHYRFMLEGLRECANDLRQRGAIFRVDTGVMASKVAEYARGAALIVADEGKLAFERAWRKEIAAMRGMPPMILVETESVVPSFAASDHLEWSAATLRKKISAKLPFFLKSAELGEGFPVPECRVSVRASDFPSRDELFASHEGAAGDPLLALQKLRFAPGRLAGMARFGEFLSSGALERYAEDRNDPCRAGQSDMSPYLHFGQVSPVALAGAALRASESAAQAYIEQLVVRRELALNFVLFNPGYDRYESAAPEWAKKSLSERDDRRTLYGAAELEAGLTADPYWNAAQKEMLLTGKMHNYMRMYWGKRLLSWFADPAEAFNLAIRFNDRYSLDGRDPNGYAGVAWCFGRHDRPWPQQPLFGNVRSMAASGLRKKFDAERYASEVEDLYTTRRKEIS
ncbi:MAG TPA: deoxyribodipyrimidine photo-lyase [Rectinemataceae bacterium]|nr:deoxyribodipyrimidine photo-lyase [Rectinemataceae bacterium]